MIEGSGGQMSKRGAELLKKLQKGDGVASKFRPHEAWIVKSVTPSEVLVYRRVGNKIVNGEFPFDEIVRIMPDSMDY